MKKQLLKVLGLLLVNTKMKPRFWWRKNGKSLAEVLADPKYK